MTDSPTSNPHAPAALRILNRLAKSWPPLWRASLPNADLTVLSPENPLSGELDGLLHGQHASLPYFLPNGPWVHWVTVAPGYAALQRAVDDLRAWLIPSHAWEYDVQPFVTPSTAEGQLAADLLRVSPHGYFRWTSTVAAAPIVADKLRMMRSLSARRPLTVRAEVPSLLELRHRFNLALLTGDRAAAERTIRTINHHQLDTAINTQFMRIRLLDAFGDYETIVSSGSIEHLVQVGMPHAVRAAIVRSFHARFLEPMEAQGDVAAAANAYVSHVHPLLGGLLAFVAPQDGPRETRSAAYRAWHTRDIGAANDLITVDDPFIRPLLESVIHGHDRRNRSAILISRFEEAITRGDQRAMQALGGRLLELELPEQAQEALPAEITNVLRGTLEAQPNAALRDSLRTAANQENEPLVSPEPVLPQTWTELLIAIQQHEWERARRFLALDTSVRPAVDGMAHMELQSAITAIEEFLTADVFERDREARQFAAECLNLFVEDFVKESDFPRRPFVSLYLNLLRLWASTNKSSLFPPDSQVLLALADGVLHYSPGDEPEVAAILVDWWNARRVPARMAYVLEAIELLVYRTNESEAPQRLWVEAVHLLSQHRLSMSRSEYRLWLGLGRRIGFDQVTILEALGPQSADDNAHDPWRRLTVKKVAIVSLHPRAGAEAAAEIRERTGADCLVVSEKVVGSATNSAVDADVILLVWSAVKHAVYRAFDRVRDRVVYVQGTGAGSILLAFDRWVEGKLSDAQTA